MKKETMVKRANPTKPIVFVREYMHGKICMITDHISLNPNTDFRREKVNEL